MDMLREFERTHRPASIGSRWGAAFIDYFLVTIIRICLMYVFGGYFTDSEGTFLFDVFTYAFLITFVLPWLILLPVLEGMNDGKTIGKAIVKVRVTDKQGKPVGFGVSLVRHLFDFVDYLPFLGIVGVLVASNTAERQRVGDLVAGTIVVDD